jgi:hypothetical protein
VVKFKDEDLRAAAPLFETEFFGSWGSTVLEPLYILCQPAWLLKIRAAVAKGGIEAEELLKAFEIGHTLVVVPSSLLKSQASTVARLRVALMLRSWNCLAAAWLLHTLLQAERASSCPLTTEDLLKRVLEDEASDDEAGLGKRLSQEVPEGSRGWTRAELLVVEHMRGIDHRGSDVRLDAGTLLSPSIWPRRATRANLWKWHLKVKWHWQAPRHINVLEAQAVLAAIKWRVRAKRNIGSKFLHLVDSQVSQAVLTKRRSSSYLLNKVCRRVGALELAASIHPMYGFVRSDTNPSDAPSRN